MEQLGKGFEINIYHHAQCGAGKAVQKFAEIQSREPGRDEGGADSVCRSKEWPFENSWHAERELACFKVADWKPPFYITGKNVSLTQEECQDACHKLAGRDDVSSYLEFLRKTQADGYMPIRCQAYE